MPFSNNYRLVNAKITDYRIWHKRIRAIWLDIKLELEDGTTNTPSLRRGLTDESDNFGQRVAKLVNFFDKKSLDGIVGKPVRFLQNESSTGQTYSGGFGNQALVSYLGDDLWASSKDREENLKKVYEKVLNRDTVREFPES